MKLQRHIVIPAVLLVYLAVMSIIAYPEYVSGVNSPLYYFGVIGTTLFVIILLYFSLRRRDRLRKEREDDLKSK